MQFKYVDIPATVAANNEVARVCGYAAVFDCIDFHGDIILKGAFANAMAKNIKFLWQHDVTKPIGKIINIIEDYYGLYVEAELLLEVNTSKEAYHLIKSGAISGLSIGFNPIKYYYNKNNDRFIQEIDLWEISLVTFPANRHANITFAKYHKFQILTNSIDNAIAILNSK